MRTRVSRRKGARFAGAFRVSCLNRLNRRQVIGVAGKMFSPSYAVLDRVQSSVRFPFRTVAAIPAEIAVSSQLPKTRCVWGRTIALKMTMDGCVQSTQTSSNPALVTGSGRPPAGTQRTPRDRVPAAIHAQQRSEAPSNSSRVEITHRAAVSTLALPRGFKCRITRFSRLPV